MEMASLTTGKCMHSSPVIITRIAHHTHNNRCAALDKIGDRSSDEQRKEYFREIDKDQSDGVDFEEFLEVSS